MSTRIICDVCQEHIRNESHRITVSFLDTGPGWEMAPISLDMCSWGCVKERAEEALKIRPRRKA